MDTRQGQFDILTMAGVLILLVFLVIYIKHPRAKVRDNPFVYAMTALIFLVHLPRCYLGLHGRNWSTIYGDYRIVSPAFIAVFALCVLGLLTSLWQVRRTLRMKK